MLLIALYIFNEDDHFCIIFRWIGSITPGTGCCRINNHKFDPVKEIFGGCGGGNYILPLFNRSSSCNKPFLSSFHTILLIQNIIIAGSVSGAEDGAAIVELE